MIKQLDILEKETEKFKENEKVKAVLLIGSVAYGMANDNSDLDLIVISNEDKFVSEYVEGILVEKHFSKYSTLLKRLENNPIDVYKYLYSKIIFDDNGKLEILTAKAKEIYKHYITPQKEMDDICYWLSSTKIKLLSAINSNDEMKISYLISTNTWIVLEGVWAKNNKPMPPSSIAFAKHNELTYVPFANWFIELLVGDNLSRANAMIKIINWICERKTNEHCSHYIQN